MMKKASEKIRDSKRIVVKLGSSLIVDDKTTKLKKAELTSICEDLLELKQNGHEIIIVSSGAVALGCNELGMNKKDALKVTQKQTLASIGQIALVAAYQNIMANFGVKVAQILLALEDSECRKRYLNARNTMNSLIKMGIIPIVNENDTVATSEIKFGDNDRLSARVAQMAGADMLILLSDIDGLYTADPKKDKDARFIETVDHIDDEIASFAGQSSSNVGTGGMITKLLAGKICLDAGCKMLIAKGSGMNPIKRVLNGGRATLFMTTKSPIGAFKSWLSGAIKPSGGVIIDDNAVVALNNGKSLLGVGVKELFGKFSKGDIIEVVDLNGKIIAKGLCSYDYAEARRIIGKTSLLG